MVAVFNFHVYELRDETEATGSGEWLGRGLHRKHKQVDGVLFAVCVEKVLQAALESGTAKPSDG